MIPRVLLAVALAGGLGAVSRDVVDLEARELDASPGWVRLVPTTPGGGARPGPHRELARVPIRAGDDLRARVCLPPGAAPPDVDLVLWDPAARAIVHEVSLPAEARAQGVARGPACLDVARGRDLAVDATLALEAVWAGPAPDGGLRARLAVTRDPPRGVAVALGVVALGALGLLLAFARREDLPAADAAPAPGEATARALGGLLWVLATLVAAGLLPLGGATGAWLRGALLAGSTLAAALLLGGRRVPLGLETPRRARWLTLAAPLVGAALLAVGLGLQRVVPATAEAPVEALVRWPSGVVAAAGLAVLAPVAEELFFRGFLWGAVAPHAGRGGAVALTTAAFALVHLPQTVGAWGAFAAIAALGLGLGLLRAIAGGVLPCAVAHLAHNALAVAPALVEAW